MALDRSHEDWGQLMFFRCGDLIVELVRRPGSACRERPDSCLGLSWRVADVDAARARLAAAGIDVSEVRAGRKPGTRVMTRAQRHLRHPHVDAGTRNAGLIGRTRREAFDLFTTAGIGISKAISMRDTSC